MLTSNRLSPDLALMLVERCRWYELALRRHGFTSEELMRRAESAAAIGLKRRGAALGDRFGDLVSRLTLVGLQAALSYDPEREHLAYGRNGGDPFSGYLDDILDKRIDDFFRLRSEGFSDRRYKNYGQVTPSEQVVGEEEHQHAVEEAIERLDSVDNLEWYTEAAEVEGIPLHDWVVRALNERASRHVTRPRSTQRIRREREPGPDHWPGQKVEVA